MTPMSWRKECLNTNFHDTLFELALELKGYYTNA